MFHHYTCVSLSCTLFSWGPDPLLSPEELVLQDLLWVHFHLHPAPQVPKQGFFFFFFFFFFGVEFNIYTILF